MSDSKIIVALDVSTKNDLDALIERLHPKQCRLKVGKELFTRFGPEVVLGLVKKDFDVFLDLKYHDIPNTVAQACAVAADLGVWMLNVHALGGRRMMTAAQEALVNKQQRPLLIGVTILTSMQADELPEVGISEAPAEAVSRLAKLAKQSGLDGVVCSAWEAEELKQSCGNDFCLVTPGIRLEGDAKGDQRRVMTPVDAIKSGAHYLVIGRSITGSDEPLSTLQKINADIEVLTA